MLAGLVVAYLLYRYFRALSHFRKNMSSELPQEPPEWQYDRYFILPAIVGGLLWLTLSGSVHPLLLGLESPRVQKTKLVLILGAISLLVPLPITYNLSYGSFLAMHLVVRGGGRVWRVWRKRQRMRALELKYRGQLYK